MDWAMFVLFRLLEEYCGIFAQSKNCGAREPLLCNAHSVHARNNREIVGNGT
jgi:hypothetical protein